MLDLFLTAFVLAFFAVGVRRPFLWVLAYAYIDILAPQKISWFLLQKIPISLIAFVLAFLGWAYVDEKRGGRFTFRQALIAVLLVYCGISTLNADFPAEALEKWGWVWKSLVFALFLPLTLRTRLRIEALALFMVLSAGAIVISGGIKTLASGGGYGTLRLFVTDNSGIYEGSIISTVAIAIIPLIVWLAKHGTIFPPDWRVRTYAVALAFACVLIPIGTGARTGLVCLAILAAMALRTAKRPFLYASLIGLAGLISLPMLPASFTERMSTIENHSADQSASTRLAVWAWTLDYVKDHPFGGGFDAYRQNDLKIEVVDAQETGNTTNIETETMTDKARAYHSSYFEMLGEQGYPGLALWLLLHILGVITMEILLRRWRTRTEDRTRWIAPMAGALQQAQIVYLFGSLFVGIAFQPFCYMLVALQCALWTHAKLLRRAEQRADATERPRPAYLRQKRAAKEAPPAVA